MTEENYKYRLSLLRNEFEGNSGFKTPMIPKFKASDGDFDDLRLIGFDKVKADNNNHTERMVHFFLYDYKFEKIWEKPDDYIELLKDYRAVLTPDFSLYIEMTPIMQIYNTFRNRWCGAYLVSKGIRVIPSVSWGSESSFDFCFDGIEKGSPVAVSTYMSSEHDNSSAQKEFFLKGYNEMLRRIDPEKIICYHEPFDEMGGDIVYVNYELSSWRYMNDEPYVPSNYAKYISGQMPLPKNSGILIKSGYTVRDEFNSKGMGSVEGGEWKPNPDKPEEERFLGKPGEIKETIMPNGNKFETKIGDNGRAIKERHHTNHGFPKYHTIPHDHIIKWDNGRGRPDFSEPQINYSDGDVPEFKYFKEITRIMGDKITVGQDANLNFETISDFKWCMTYGGEVEFEYNGKTFGVCSKLRRTLDSDIQKVIYESCKEETGMWCDTADEILEYIIDGVRLRDIITEVRVVSRTI